MITLFLVSKSVVCQLNGMYKSQYGFTLIIKDYKKGNSFSFDLTCQNSKSECYCFELSGTAESDPLDEQNNGKISYIFYGIGESSEEEPLAWFESKGDIIKIIFPERTSFYCRNCLEVDTIYKRNITPKQKQNSPHIKKNLKSKK